MSDSRKIFVNNELHFESCYFDIAQLYFDEAKRSFIDGNFKSAIIMAVSSLESCIKTDYIRYLPDFDNTLGDEDQRRRKITSRDSREHNNLTYLLGQYFVRYERLPNVQRAIKERIVEIRNCLVHTGDGNQIIDLDREGLEEYCQQILHDVKILLNHREEKIDKRGKCQQCGSDLEVVSRSEALHSNRYVRCSNRCFNKKLYPYEDPSLRDPSSSCNCGLPLVQGKTLKRDSPNGKEYYRCLGNCKFTPARCQKCKGGMSIKHSKGITGTGIFFVCQNTECKATWS